MRQRRGGPVALKGEEKQSSTSWSFRQRLYSPHAADGQTHLLASAAVGEGSFDVAGPAVPSCGSLDLPAGSVLGGGSLILKGIGEPLLALLSSDAGSGCSGDLQMHQATGENDISHTALTKSRQICSCLSLRKVTQKDAPKNPTRSDSLGRRIVPGFVDGWRWRTGADEPDTSTPLSQNTEGLRPLRSKSR